MNEFNVKSYIAEERERLKDRFKKFTDSDFYFQINDFSENESDNKMYLNQIIKDCDFYGIKYMHTYCAKGNIPNYGEEVNMIPTINIGLKTKWAPCLNDFNDIEGATPGSRYIPAVARGIIDFLMANWVNVIDSNVLIIGRGVTMGSRLIRGFMNWNANVMVAHSRTSVPQRNNLAREADIIITATPNAKQFRFGDFPSDAIIIDAGTCFDENGKLCGNIDPGYYLFFNKYIPSPGGVGPLTRLALFKNLYDCFDLKDDQK